MSVTAQTSSFIETSTDRDNITYVNYSGDGNELKHNTDSFLELWEDFDKYNNIFGGIVLCFIVIGTIDNILVFIMTGDKKLSSLSYSVYLKCMAVSDSCLLITTLIYQPERNYFLETFLEVQLLICTLPNIFSILSSWLVVGLTIDRYVCVCFPLKRELVCSRMKAAVFCSVLLGLAVVLILPFPFNTEFVRGECFPSEKVTYYYIFIRLLFSSTLPCLVILVLNIVIIIHVQRSRKFRNTFTSSSSNLASRQQDSATRPLVLVSVLAFVTMMPVALSEAVVTAIRLLDSDFKYMATLGNIWSVCFIIYLLNFGQNFCILIGSSSNYRQIFRKRLKCCILKRNQGSKANKVILTNIPSISRDPETESTEPGYGDTHCFEQ